MTGSHHQANDAQPPLSAQWRAVLGLYYISEQLVRELRQDAREFHKISGIRISEREEIAVERELAPKPLYIKFKISNWLLGGVPYDQKNLAKTFNNIVTPGVHTPETENPDKVPDLLNVSVRNVTIQEIQLGLENKKFTLAVDEMKHDPTLLAVRPTPGVGNNPTKTDVILGIQISPERSHSMQDAKVTDKGPKLSKPDYWTSTMGDFEAAIKQEYPAQYKTGKGEFKDYLMYKRPRSPSNAEALLFDKDNDGFLNSISLKEYHDMPPATKVIHNTFDSRGMQDMVDALIELESYLIRKKYPDKNLFEVYAMVSQNIGGYNLTAFGAGTAFDCYFVNRMNQGYPSASMVPMQHALENCNKWALSNIDDLVLWVGKDGEPHITHDEDEHIRYLLNNAKDLAFYVNPRWDLTQAKWGPVVEMLIKNDVQCDSDLLLSYVQQKNTARETIDSSIWNLCLAQAEKIGLKDTMLEKFDATKSIVGDNKDIPTRKPSQT